MPVIFMDSSGVVKRYVQETGSVWVSGQFTAAPTNRVVIASITGVEVVAAITRRARGGTITPAESTSACGLFLADLNTDFRAITVTDVLLRQAITLTRTYTLRGYDAVQLAAANEVNRLSLAAGAGPLLFIAADKELNAAAQSEGLMVDDPNAHP